MLLRCDPKFAFVAALALSVSMDVGHALDQTSPTVRVAGGALTGKREGAIGIFKGVPFAAPPVGSWRWREPQPVVSWLGNRDATEAGRPCIQSPAGLDAYLAPLAATYGVPFERAPLRPSEDCLYLNVFAPWPAGLKGLPVMVWLHGGSNRVGTGADESYNGSSLAAHGVIVVTVNYRLGMMGFFAHPELTGESAHHSSGNYGLLDQIAALRWVRENIAQFGGDAENVTVFGESAGSVDATTLMASPLVTGLFRRVIAESGPAFGLGPALLLAEAQGVGSAVGRAAVSESRATNKTALAVLRQMPAEEVVALDARIVAQRYKSFDPNGSVVDGWLLPQPAAKAFGLGKIQKVDLLAGLNGRELSAFRIGAAVSAKQAGQPAQKDGMSAAVKKLADAAHPLYGGWTDMAVGLYLAEILAHGDVAVDKASNEMLVACPVGAEAALVRSLGARAFVYQFDRTVPGKGAGTLGAFHGLALPYVFDAFRSRSWRWLPFTAVDQKLSDVMQTYWTNFAKFGDPNATGLPVWKVWDGKEEPYMEFSQKGDAVAQKTFSPAFCHLGVGRLREGLGGQ